MKTTICCLRQHDRSTVWVIFRTLVSLLFVVFCPHDMLANPPVISEITASGRIEFNEVPDAMGYRVEWASEAGGPWTNFTGEHGQWLDVDVTPSSRR